MEEDSSLRDRFINRFGSVTAKVLRYAGGAFAAGRAAHGQNIAILGVSRFEARISNYWQLDCLSGKAPDFSEKDPLWNLFVCPTQGVSPSRRFQFQKCGQHFIRMHNETLSVVMMRICNPDRSPVSING
jgi:hypothetical protein